MKRTTHDYRGSVFTIEFEPDRPGHSVVFPDLPDMITGGSTIAEDFAHACEALDLYIGGSRAIGLSMNCGLTKLEEIKDVGER